MNLEYLGANDKETLEKRLQVVASAGALSQSDDNAIITYENHADFEENVKLAKRICNMRHMSISDHDYLVFALDNVSAIVEQELIKHRLMSFTIKSRRYVDFRDVGYYVPTFKDDDGVVMDNNERLQGYYKKHMDKLFEKYKNLVDNGIHVEDARYILPYSFHSSIIFGCDANELGMKFEEIINTLVPYLAPTLKKEENDVKYKKDFYLIDEAYKESDMLESKKLDGVKLIGDNETVTSLLTSDFKICVYYLMKKYNLPYETAVENMHRLSERDPLFKMKLINKIVNGEEERLLEQVNYHFEFPVSLAALTHFSRHRMQSINIPDFVPVKLDNYYIPEKLLPYRIEYDDIFKENKKMKEYFYNIGVREEDLIYFHLAGNSFNISTNINAREMLAMSNLRTCERTMKETRDIVNDMIKITDHYTPIISSFYGPSCETKHFCPEGKKHCPNMKEHLDNYSERMKRFIELEKEEEQVLKLK